MAAADDRISLARGAEVRLGRLRVLPGLRQVVRDDGASEVLEPRVMQVLVALACAEGAILTRDDLTWSCWEGRIVGEDAINRVISRLRRVAEGIGEGSFRIETITKVGYRLIRDGVTPDPFVAEPPVPRSSGFRRWRRPAAIGGAAVALIGAGSLMWGLGETASRHRTVLVQALRVGQGDDYARLFRQVLSTDLSRMILSNDTTLSIADAADGSSAPGSGADLVISGDAQSVGRLMHVSVKLTDPRGPGMIWAIEMSRPLAEAEGLRRELAAKIADVLICALGTSDHSGPQPPLDIETMRLYLGACEFWHTDAFEAARRFEQVVKRRPDFARAWGHLAAQTALFTYGLPLAERPRSFAKAEALALHTLSLDPREGGALTARIFARPGIDKWMQRAALLRDELAIRDDSPHLHGRKAVDLQMVGRNREALPEFRRARMSDPFSPAYARYLADALAFGGEPDEAASVLRQARQVWPNVDLLAWEQFEIAVRLGDTATARSLFDEAMSGADMPAERRAIWMLMIRARAEPTAGNIAAAKTAIVGARMKVLEDFWELIQHLVMLGDIDGAFALADRARGLPQEGRIVSENVLFRDFLAPFRADPRFMTLAARRGLVAIWQQTGTWPDFCQEPTLPYDCKAEAARALSRNPRPLI